VESKNVTVYIQLKETQILIDISRKNVYDIASTGKNVLFIGTKNQAKKAIENLAKTCSMPYVTERWLGGMLTNFMTIRKSIKRLAGIDKMEVDGTFDKITKKERLMLSRERDRLRTVFGGIEEMTRLPGALFVVDIKKEHLAIKEAKILGIPVFALVDTNTDPEDVDFPIPCNDDSLKAIDLIVKVMADAVNEGNAIANARRAEMASDPERMAKEGELDDEEPKVKRRMRTRKIVKPGGGPRRTDKRGPSQDTDSLSDDSDSQETDTQGSEE
jgi:small subunit ribosomal protein S2